MRGPMGRSIVAPAALVAELLVSQLHSVRNVSGPRSSGIGSLLAASCFPCSSGCPPASLSLPSPSRPVWSASCSSPLQTSPSRPVYCPCPLGGLSVASCFQFSSHVGHRAPRQHLEAEEAQPGRAGTPEARIIHGTSAVCIYVMYVCV